MSSSKLPRSSIFSIYILTDGQFTAAVTIKLPNPVVSTQITGGFTIFRCSRNRKLQFRDKSDSKRFCSSVQTSFLMAKHGSGNHTSSEIDTEEVASSLEVILNQILAFFSQDSRLIYLE